MSERGDDQGFKIGDRVTWGGPGDHYGQIVSLDYEDFPAFREPQLVVRVRAPFAFGGDFAMRACHFRPVPDAPPEHST